MIVAQTILALIGAYLASGLLFAAAFVTLGVGRIDPAARGTSLAFRLLIVPGTVLVWPVLVCKWLKASRETTP